MNKQHSSEMQSIRKKLLAAIAMLLVACIMTVSSTYAWFTLSTAPEVKGITTTVGANGNLEIALGTYDTVYQGVTPQAYEGSSMDAGTDVTVSNTTWGNLIDLSDSYGVHRVTLYPTRLNVENGIFNMLSPLQYAIYGTDGRVADLSGNTLLGGYDVTSDGFISDTEKTSAGFNGVGSVSDMSPRKFAIRNYRAAINSYRLAAMDEAKGAISLYSGDLAALALDNQGGSEDKEIAPEKIAILEKLITKLEKSNENIGNSLKSAALLSITGVKDLSDDGWEVAMATAEDMTIREIINSIGSIAGEGTPTINLPEKVTDVVVKHEDITTLLNNAKTTLTSAGEDDIYTWGEVSETVGKLLNKTGILICGETIEDIAATKDSNEAGSAFDNVTTAVLNGGITFTFGAGSGIFSDIAEMTGEYSSSIQFPADYRVEGINVSTKPWPVYVESPYVDNTELETTGDLGSAYTLLLDVDYVGDDTNTEKALTDTYGYTVDMLFRTNAADSFLQLQTAAANRIYSDNDNAALMGGGSNMSFTISPEYNAEKINGLAAGIRVVFYETSTTQPTILGVATLDTENGEESGDQYKLDLKLADYTLADDGKITTTGEKADTSICALAANTPKRITALVYLDGDKIDNSNIGVIENLNGVLNLQFSSSATLTPMDNNALKNTVVE